MIKFNKLEFTPDQVFFTSDLHYHHKNISKDSVWDRIGQDDKVRKFSLHDMNKNIVETINKHVSWNDCLIHLGDWSFGGEDKIVELRKQLHVETIICCYGNHDQHQLRNGFPYYGFDKRSNHILYLNIEGQNIICCHYPMISWHQQHRGTWHLYGHCHGNLNNLYNNKSIDVGWDTFNDYHTQYTPYSFGELQLIMESKKLGIVDHH